MFQQRHALKEQTRDLLLETAERCQAVICCRVTPLQKVSTMSVHLHLVHHTSKGTVFIDLLTCLFISMCEPNGRLAWYWQTVLYRHPVWNVHTVLRTLPHQMLYLLYTHVHTEWAVCAVSVHYRNPATAIVGWHLHTNMCVLGCICVRVCVGAMVVASIGWYFVHLCAVTYL